MFLTRIKRRYRRIQLSGSCEQSLETSCIIEGLYYGSNVVNITKLK
jgi:hypothetical protein